MISLSRAGKRMGRAVGRFVADSFACRSCGRQASLLVPICRHCGTRYPIKVNLAPSVLLTAAGSEAAILFFRFI